MKKILFVLLFGFCLNVSCEKENFLFEEIIGKWQLVEGFNLMVGGVYSIDEEHQRIEEYTKNGERIRYDYLGNETSRCGYTITDSTIIIFGKELNGEDWELDYECWFKQDTLVVHNDGGFEFYNEFFVRID